MKSTDQKEIIAFTDRILTDLEWIEDIDDPELEEPWNQIRAGIMQMRLLASEALERRAKHIMLEILHAEGEQREVTATELSERAADELDIDDALDDEQHPIWEWSVEVLEEGDEDDEEEEEEQPS